MGLDDGSSWKVVVMEAEGKTWWWSASLKSTSSWNREHSKPSLLRPPTPETLSLLFLLLLSLFILSPTITSRPIHQGSFTKDAYLDSQVSMVLSPILHSPCCSEYAGTNMQLKARLRQSTSLQARSCGCAFNKTVPDMLTSACHLKCELHVSSTSWYSIGLDPSGVEQYLSCRDTARCMKYCFPRSIVGPSVADPSISSIE
jgi:hypothetical protein